MYNSPRSYVQLADGGGEGGGGGLGENFFASLVNVRNLPMHRGEGGGGEGEGGGGEGEGGEGEGGGGDGGSEGDGGGGEGAGGEGATRVSQNLKVWAPRTRTLAPCHNNLGSYKSQFLPDH